MFSRMRAGSQVNTCGHSWNDIMPTCRECATWDLFCRAHHGKQIGWTTVLPKHWHDYRMRFGDMVDRLWAEGYGGYDKVWSDEVWKDTCLMLPSQMYNREARENHLRFVQKGSLAFQHLYFFCPEEIKWQNRANWRPAQLRRIDEARLLQHGFSGYTRDIHAAGITPRTRDRVRCSL